jgi:fluoride exporter
MTGLAWLGVALGGALGALLRAWVAVTWPNQSGHWPWATFAVNLVGAFAIGLLAAWLQQRGGLWVKPWLMTGLLGGLTTYSTFALEAWMLFTQGAWLLALSYGLLTLVATFCLAGLGFECGRWLWAAG